MMLGPRPSIGFNEQVAQATGRLDPVFQGSVSGEISASRIVMPLGIAAGSGKIMEVHAGVFLTGKNDTQVPTGTFDVKINGTTCLSTNPVIAHVSGELSKRKSTLSVVAGVTAGVVDQTANDLSAGDLLTWEFTYAGSTSPTSKMVAPFVLVKTQPDN
jgi:hypothetical protein